MYSNLCDTKYHENYPFVLLQITVPNVVGYLNIANNLVGNITDILGSHSEIPQKSRQYLCTIATMPTIKITRQIGNPDFASADSTTMSSSSYFTSPPF
ncbi:hypothetical protein TNCV_1941631 [Trichonephila clavipes]|uniref:Uncharacterized protein n=1 Tax=Trichonephila clavipes TaxID=2585209 RepID=A0A8X6VIW2_TRICX|nr:hypothetical protein TNCV_1941631 [Trichonephila clavipes]